MLWFGQNATEETCVFGLNRPSDVKTYVAVIDVMTNVLTSWNFLMTWDTVRRQTNCLCYGVFFTSWRTLCCHGIFLTPWPAFCRPDIFCLIISRKQNIMKTCFWCYNELFWRHYMFLRSWRIFLMSWRVFDFMTNFWHHGKLFDVMPCFWFYDKHFDIMTSFWR